MIRQALAPATSTSVDGLVADQRAVVALGQRVGHRVEVAVPANGASSVRRRSWPPGRASGDPDPPARRARARAPRRAPARRRPPCATPPRRHGAESVRPDDRPSQSTPRRVGRRARRAAAQWAAVNPPAAARRTCARFTAASASASWSASARRSARLHGLAGPARRRSGRPARPRRTGSSRCRSTPRRSPPWTATSWSPSGVRSVTVAISRAPTNGEWPGRKAMSPPPTVRAMTMSASPE